jgi:transcriptional regulator of acetoin/glycerol metabolism
MTMTQPYTEVPDDVRITLDEIRRRHVVHVLDACGGNRSEAAKILGVDRKTLYRRLRRWGVAR